MLFRQTLSMGSIGRGAVTLACALAVTGLTGCKTVSQAEYDEAVAENTELRDRVDQLQGELDEAEGDKAILRDEIADREARIRDLERNNISSAATGMDPAAASGFPGATMRGSDMVMTVAGDVLFDSGQITIKNDGKRTLDQVARLILSQYQGNAVRVAGFTDSDPIRRSQWKTNERLSAERALAVEAYLVSRGVDPDQVYSAAMGPAEPRPTKKESRRVEIIILDAGR